MSEEVKRYCMRAAGSIVQPIEVPYSGTWVPSADHDRIVGERDAVIEQCSWECTWRQVEIEGLRDERDALLVKVTELRAEVERLRAALAEIAAWPDGGSKYGQGPIKTFAVMTLEASRCS